MSLVELRKRAEQLRSLEPYVEDPDEALTLLYTPRSAISDALRVSPREIRGSSSSKAERARIAKMISEVRSMAPAVDASAPITSLTNPFLRPPRATDVPPPWASAAPLAATSRRRRSFLPLVVLALAAAIAFGLWRDAGARAEITAELDRARTVVLEMMIR